MEEGTRSALATGRLVPGCLFCVGGGHVNYMARALELAVRAKRICKPNPAVGAVLVKDGILIGEGYTQPAGDAHAEIMALRQAGQQAAGSTLYVTLEPCSHQGRTAPCVHAILESRVAEVHVAMVDASPWVNGQGLALLQAAGVRTYVGELSEAARKLNEGYFTWVERGRPFVTGIYGGTADGLGTFLHPHGESVITPDSLADLYDEVDRVVVDRRGASTDITSWTSALQALAGQQVQHVLLDIESETLEALLVHGLVDRVAVVAADRRLEQPPTNPLAELSLNGLVACSPGS